MFSTQATRPCPRVVKKPRQTRQIIDDANALFKFALNLPEVNSTEVKVRARSQCTLTQFELFLKFPPSLSVSIACDISTGCAAGVSGRFFKRPPWF